ncbi:hypothetical protein [Parasynechococcus sp.]|uniref:hypothetical protein n=1 Tax=Parasynechococcus sp. TaxID=3101203 RepID=UPI003704527E
MVIATGARPSINLAGPLQVDAWGGAGLQRMEQRCLDWIVIRLSKDDSRSATEGVLVTNADQQHSSPPCGTGVPGCPGAASGLWSHPGNHQLP